MRLLVERGTVSQELIDRVIDELNADDVVVCDRQRLEQIVRADDVIIMSNADLSKLATIKKPTVQLQELSVSAFSASIGDTELDLQQSEVAILYELAAARGGFVKREELHARCWRRPPRLRSVDVAIHRLRRKVETTTRFRILAERSLGYRLAAPLSRTTCVLVVDDEPLMQSAYTRFFGHLGIEVEFANDAAMGIKLARQKNYSAYFLDLMMPGACGSTVIPVIQERKPFAPIMIVTARDDKEAVGLSEKYGVVYAEKPVDPEALRRFVRRNVFGEIG